MWYVKIKRSKLWIIHQIYPHNFVCMHCKKSFQCEASCGIKVCPICNRGSFVLSRSGASDFNSNMAGEITISKLDINTLKYRVDTNSYTCEIDFHDLILQYPRFKKVSQISNEEIIRQLYINDDLTKYAENVVKI